VKRWVLIGLIVAGVGLALSCAGLVTMFRRVYEPTPRVAEPDPQYAGLAVPPFLLVDQDGRKVDEHLFDDRVTVLDFIFTNCPFACPMMTQAMQELALKLARTPVRFVSISVDPAHDTPQRLRGYGTERGIDFKEWTFLTGDEEAVRSIATGALKFALQPDPSRTVYLAEGGTMPNVLHPTQFILVGPDRRVLGIYHSSDPDDLRKLALDARAASRGAKR
jgi:cytochrome oxidase Cu insertion factor (SCO1/SenC/PrrC family)